MRRAYNDLDQNGYEQQTVNRKSCRRHVETNRDMAPDYLAEIRWSQRFGNKYMKNIVVINMKNIWKTIQNNTMPV